MLVPGVEGVRVPARFWVLATLVPRGRVRFGARLCRRERGRSPASDHRRRRGSPAGGGLACSAAADRGAGLAPIARRRSPARVAHGIDPAISSRSIARRSTAARWQTDTAATSRLITGRSRNCWPAANPAVLGPIWPRFGELEVIVNHDRDGDRRGAASQRAAERPARERGRDYTIYRVPQNPERLQVPQFSAAALEYCRHSRIDRRGSRRPDDRRRS